ncbi:recombinase family protein [Bdellovibrionota bacterium FG-1]
MKALTVATYSRCSTADKGQNPEVQVHELRRYCEARGWLITEEIIDHGYSGGSGADQRPGLRKLMALVRARQVDGVVVVKMDRFFRSLKNLVTTLDEFQSLGVTFTATQDQIDMSSASGRLMLHLIGAFSEFEKSLLRERTMLGLDHARRSGKTLGRPKRRDDKAIADLRSQGLSIRQIALALGVSTTAVQRGLSVTKSGLRRAS